MTHDKSFMFGLIYVFKGLFLYFKLEKLLLSTLGGLILAKTKNISQISNFADLYLPIYIFYYLESFLNKCFCSSKLKLSCSDGKKRSRCPCLRNGEKCNVRCRCKKCGNDKEILEAPMKGCRCSSSCKDNERKTRCKCFKANIACGVDCHCHNCENPFGIGSNKTVSNGKKGMKRPHETSYGKTRTSKIVDYEMSEGTWTEMETVTIFCVTNTLAALGEDCSFENVYVFYHLLFENCSNIIVIRRKSKKQIQAKLRYMKT